MHLMALGGYDPDTHFFHALIAQFRTCTPLTGLLESEK